MSQSEQSNNVGGEQEFLLEMMKNLTDAMGHLETYNLEVAECKANLNAKLDGVLANVKYIRVVPALDLTEKMGKMKGVASKGLSKMIKNLDSSDESRRLIHAETLSELTAICVSAVKLSVSALSINQ